MVLLWLRNFSFRGTILLRTAPEHGCLASVMGKAICFPIQELQLSGFLNVRLFEIRMWQHPPSSVSLWTIVSQTPTPRKLRNSEDNWAFWLLTKFFSLVRKDSSVQWLISLLLKLPGIFLQCCTVLASCNCQLWGNQSQLKNYLDHIGLWVDLWGIVLMVPQGRRIQPTVGTPFHRLGPELHVNEWSRPAEKCASRAHGCIQFSVLWTVDMMWLATQVPVSAFLKCGSRT